MVIVIVLLLANSLYYPTHRVASLKQAKQIIHFIQVSLNRATSIIHG